jgi:phage terminase small subunit
MEMNSKLTEKQKRFCEYYLILGNGTQSAIKAGYKETNANKIAYMNLCNPIIRKEIDKMKEKITSENIMTAEKVLEELTTIALSDKNTFARLKALELLGKRYKLFTDTVEIEQKNIPTFIDDRLVEDD